MSRPLFLWPVITSPVRHDCHAVAYFFTDSDAAAFVNSEPGNLFIGPPNYDRRKRGYRPAEKPSGYAEWLIEIGRSPDNGNVRVAA